MQLAQALRRWAWPLPHPASVPPADGSCPFAALDDGVLSLILARRRWAPLVCRRWLRVVRKSFRGCVRPNGTLEELLHVLAVRPGSTSLSLSGFDCTQISPRESGALVRSCPAVRLVTARLNRSANDALLSFASGVAAVDVGDCPGITAAGVQTLVASGTACVGLRPCLDMFENKYVVGPDWVTALVADHVQEIDLSGCHLLLPAEFEPLAKCRSLKRLGVSSTTVRCRNLQPICRGCRALLHVSLSAECFEEGGSVGDLVASSKALVSVEMDGRVDSVSVLGTLGTLQYLEFVNTRCPELVVAAAQTVRFVRYFDDQLGRCEDTVFDGAAGSKLELLVAPFQWQPKVATRLRALCPAVRLEEHFDLHDDETLFPFSRFASRGRDTEM
jgi:hypothetical protein